MKYKRCCLGRSVPKSFSEALRELFAVGSPTPVPAGTLVVSDLASLRSYADELAVAQPLFGQDRCNAILNSYRMIQMFRSFSDREAALTGDDTFSQRTLRDFQDVLRWLTYKIFTLCRAGGTVTTTRPVDARPALETVRFFRIFSMVQDFILAAEKGYMSAEFSPDGKTISFRPPSGERGERLANRIVRKALDSRVERTGFLSDVIAKEAKTYDYLLQDVEANATVDVVGYAVPYTPSSDTVRRAIEMQYSVSGSDHDAIQPGSK